MDFLNKAVAQLSELFRSMTPGARLTAGLLLVVVVVSLGYLFRYETSGADVYLMNGEPIQGGEMNEMVAAFGKAGLTDFEIQGNKDSRAAREAGGLHGRAGRRQGPAVAFRRQSTPRDRWWKRVPQQ